MTEGKHNRPSLKRLRHLKNLVGCEVGVDKGDNAVNIFNILDIKWLYLVDPYQVDPALKNVSFNKLRKWEKKIVWIYKTSEEAHKDVPDDSLDFVYIDGNHQYEFVKKDIRLWEPKVKGGGLICGHDYQMKRKVRRAVDEIYGERVNHGLCFFVKANKPVYDWWVWKIVK